ncbi:hypothetical protein EBB07_28230 [Paenibacillaceae bacterium]|nr:hypothetical protein EBB07_28230 [Paenibacillaceae bacterium]
MVRIKTKIKQIDREFLIFASLLMLSDADKAFETIENHTEENKMALQNYLEKYYKDDLEAEKLENIINQLKNEYYKKVIKKIPKSE